MLSRILSLSILILLAATPSYASLNSDVFWKRHHATLGDSLFSIRYPKDYILDDSSRDIGPEHFYATKSSNVVTLIKQASHNNLMTAMISLEKSKTSHSGCSADQFPSLLSEKKLPSKTFMDYSNNISYSIAESTISYDTQTSYEKIWAIRNAKPCLAFRYFYRSILEADDENTKPFDDTALIKTFDNIRKSFMSRSN